MNDYKKQNAKCLCCPVCGSTYIALLHTGSAFMSWLWLVECQACRHRGKTKLFMRRAVKAWNKERKSNDKRKSH